MEYSGPVEIEGEAVFPETGLWNVHGKFTTHAKYANGVTMEISIIAMKLPRKLHWEPKNEKFINDNEANKMLSRPQRGPYGTTKIKL